MTRVSLLSLVAALSAAACLAVGCSGGDTGASTDMTLVHEDALLNPDQATGPAGGDTDDADAGDDDPKASAGGCNTGCGPGDHVVGHLDDDDIETMLADLGERLPGDGGLALDTVLFHWRDIAPYVDEHGPGPAGPAWGEVLEREFDKRWVHLIVRVRGEENRAVRLVMDRVVPLGEHYHLHPEIHEGVQPLAIGGRCERTALGHIWARF